MTKEENDKNESQSNIYRQRVIELRESVGRSVTGKVDFQNEDFANLSDADKVEVTNRMKLAIANDPERYGQSRATIATALDDVAAPVEYTLGDAVVSATEGAKEGAANISAAVNKWRTPLMIGAGIAIVLVVVLIVKAQAKPVIAAVSS